MAEQKTIQRMLHAKYLHFKSGRKKDFKPPAIDALLLKVASAAPKFAQRHYPYTNGISQGTGCAFLDRIRARKNGKGVFFDVSAYTYGMSVEQFNPDFNKPKPDVSQGQIKDAQGNVREILHTYRCIALGQTVLVEYNRQAGGMYRLALLLSHVFHAHVDVELPNVELIDVAMSKLDKAIKAGGGVDSVSARVIGASKPSSNDYITHRMSELRSKVKGTRHVRAMWDSGDNVLDAASVLALADEYRDESSPMDKLAIHLKDGGIITSLGKYRERRRIDADLTTDGAMVVADVETGLCHYLDELRAIQDGWRMIDDQGNFVAPKVVSSKG